MDILNDLDPSPISLASSTGTSITLPWAMSESGQLIAQLGTGCHLGKLQSNNAVAPFETQPAISAGTFRENIRFRNEVGAKSSFHKAITFSQANKSDHMIMSAEVSAGCEFANDMKGSVQSTIRTGVIYFDQPRLSLDAIADIRRSKRDRVYFSQQYGDYYVASLRLGADAGLLASVSTKNRSESESLEVKAKLHVLWWDIEKSYNEEHHAHEAWSVFDITAFETLSGLNVQSGALQQDPQTVAWNYIQGVSNLEKSVRDKMSELGLEEDKSLTHEDVQKI
ncbi:uncharacterized protein PGRI_055080 [Penicillium griseofulvum]|uniref:Uncharacterized protein n=1 Tax=Penicillium patulum TaxID=5078 RepID=A0A135LCF5_PENPA|nr:uncharacterized protein PGRI_055080 [Penicillium griseofulvum]KXG46652.1 hypothetical protein PGRI_055080 [Penicillium griseofulvum]